MTVTVNPPPPASPPRQPPIRRRAVAVVAAAVLAAAGLAGGLAAAFSGSTASPAATSPSSAKSPSTASASYAYYQSVMGRYRLGPGSMMGDSGYAWMLGTAGYDWMMGGTAAPGWMTGSTLPGFMSATGTDPGSVMGSLFADAPGPRVSETQATRLGDQAPAGATIDRATNRITFTTTTVQFAILASPSMPAESFLVAGLTNPTIVVPAGAKVTIEVINADEDMAHGLVITTPGSASSWMPMMTAAPAFPGAALWFLGETTSAGMHEGTVSFTASTPGTYQYLCPVPGHAQEGMLGSFIVV